MVSATVEDYIKHIYVISEASKAGVASMGQVASALSVVPGTATTMVKALAEAGLATYVPRVSVHLTPQGRTLALHVLRRHRLVEQFLVEVLGFDWSEVHEEAEQLEHVISDRLLDRIDELLGHPTEDPHGDPIPNAAGELNNEDFESLADCALGEVFFIARVSDQDIAFLQYLTGVGLNPGETVIVSERVAGADAVTIEVGAKKNKVTIGLNAAVKILVRA
jgi:DtxR family Mn-dependent transcriptional regulator